MHTGIRGVGQVSLSVVATVLVILLIPFRAEAASWSLKEAAQPWKGQTLRLIGESLPPLEALDKVKQEFEQITGVTVVIEQYGHEEVIEKTTADFAGRTGTYDLILNPHREIGRLIQNGWVQPLDKFLNDPKLRDPRFDLEGVFINKTWFEETTMYEGKIYALPFHQISMYLWWRYDLLEHPEAKRREVQSSSRRAESISEQVWVCTSSPACYLERIS